MQLSDLLIEFFGIDLLMESATFIDLLNVSFRIFVGLWITCFIIRSMFMVLRAPDIRLWGDLMRKRINITMCESVLHDLDDYKKRCKKYKNNSRGYFLEECVRYYLKTHALVKREEI